MADDLRALPTDELVGRAKDLDAKATKGPWCGHMHDRGTSTSPVLGYTITSGQPENNMIADYVSCHDTQFISAARELVPELTRRLEAAQIRIAHARAALETLECFGGALAWVEAERAKGNDLCEADWVIQTARAGLREVG